MSGARRGRPPRRADAPPAEAPAPGPPADAGPGRPGGALAVAAACCELSKPGIVGLVLVTAGAGYALGAGAGGTPGSTVAAWTLLGTGLAAAGTNAFNQWLERDADARMERTRSRPLPSGRLGPAAGLTFALLTAALGVALLAWRVNLLTAALAGATFLSYGFLYTPLKRVSPASLFVGSVPGALPILGGWAAATGRVGPASAALFAILFLWQLPHFLGIGWLCREDYADGGFRVLSVVDRSGRRTGRQAVASLAALLPASLVPPLLGVGGTAYAVGAGLLGLGFLAVGVPMLGGVDRPGARRLFLASLVYLPALLGLLVTDALLL